MQIPFAVLDDKILKQLSGRLIIVRLDLNLPIMGGKILDDYRLRLGVETIKKLKKARARILIIAHLGDDKASLKSVCQKLNRLTACNWVGSIENLKKIDIKPRQAVMLENLRYNPGEKKNNKSLAKTLASGADYFLNDAFSVSHRRHMSIVGLPEFLPSLAGPVFVSEYQNLRQALKPKRPSILILGGAKFGTKLPLLKKFIDRFDQIYIGGALANPLLAFRGFPIGRSLSDNSGHGLKVLAQNQKLILPIDVWVDGPSGRRLCSVSQVGAKETIKDVGPQFVKELDENLSTVEFVLWNGPLGDYENNFDGGTLGVAKVLAQSQAYLLAGGGDTVAVLRTAKIAEQFDFISSAGGAMLDFLLNETLPGIEALKKSKRKFKLT